MAVDTHKAEVCRITLENHNNADSLEVCRIFGFTCCVRKGDFTDGQLAVYIQPDSVVDSTRPEFSFLAGHERIKVKRLRGVVSMGLLIPAPEAAVEGDDLAEHFGITHYEPPLPGSTCGEVEGGPVGIYAPKYDVESMYRHKHLFIEDEEVIATEKIHGANSRFVYAPDEDRMYCGSKNEWKRQSEGNLWWKALKSNPWIEEFCRKNPGDILYGEVFGNVQTLKYGAKPNDTFFCAFDVLRNGEWREFDEWTKDAPIEGVVPLIYRGPFDFQKLIELSDGSSTIPNAGHIREGIVVRPVKERIDDHLGRVHLKMIGNSYMEKCK